MEIREGWVVVICIAVGFASLWIGWLISFDSVQDDCVKLGRFKTNSSVYECHREGADHEGK